MLQARFNNPFKSLWSTSKFRKYTMITLLWCKHSENEKMKTKHIIMMQTLNRSADRLVQHLPLFSITHLRSLCIFILFSSNSLLSIYLFFIIISIIFIIYSHLFIGDEYHFRLLCKCDKSVYAKTVKTVFVYT